MKEFFRVSILSLCLGACFSAPALAGEEEGSNVLDRVETFLSDTQEKLEVINPFGDILSGNSVDEEDEEERDDPIEGSGELDDQDDDKDDRDDKDDDRDDKDDDRDDDRDDRR